MRSHPMRRQPLCSRARLLLVASCALLAALPIALLVGRNLDAPVEVAAGTSVNLDTVFANVLPEILTRSLEEFDANGEAPIVGGKFTRFYQSFRGATFWGYCNPDLADPCDCDCSDGVDPCFATVPPIQREARQTMEFFVPNDVDFSSTPYLYVDKAGAHDGEGYEEKALLSRVLARKGIPSAIWIEDDIYPPSGQLPTPPIHDQFGYAGTASMQHAAKRWMRTRDPMTLTDETFRFDDRYPNAQGYMLCVTFFQEYLADYYNQDPGALAWLSNVKAVYSGGSKAGGGAISAGGVDPRCVGLRLSGFKEFDTRPVTSGPGRYEADMRECPDFCPEDDPCSDSPADEHKWARWARWSYLNRDHHPSFYDVYRVCRDRSRYEHLLLLEIGGTHDWINPMGAHAAFYPDVDGMVGGLPDASENRWDYRVLRRINRDHGTFYVVGRTNGGKDVRGDQLLVFQALRHLAKGRALPRIDGAGLDVSADPSVGPWSVRVRIDDTRAEHDPLVHEKYKIHIAFSDDRDFRRCTDPIVCRDSETTPCSQNGICRDPEWDDNKPEEDFYIKITDPQVTVDGEFRTLTFDPPAEALAFVDPLVSVIVEVRIGGPVPFHIADDTVISTDCQFGNLELYPPHVCCPE